MSKLSLAIIILSLNLGFLIIMGGTSKLGAISAGLAAIAAVGVYFAWPPAGIDPDLYKPRRWSGMLIIIHLLGIFT